MRVNDLHRWDLAPTEAIKLQRELVGRLRLQSLKIRVRSVAGIDAAVGKDEIVAGVVVFSYPELEEIERASAKLKLEYPYIPGLLSFREGPCILEAISKLKHEPDVFMFDGQGIAHPRGLGIASHIGLWLDKPTIGCAKSRLVGEYKEPGLKKGSKAALTYKGKMIGAVLRTRDNVKPLFISPGHLIDIDSSVELVMNCLTEFRLPKTTREADKFVALEKSK